MFETYDLFDWFRWALAIVATIYATVITIQSLWGWYVWLAGEDKYISMLRRYVIVHGLRLRFSTFWGDVVISLLLTVIFFILWHGHHLIYDLDSRLDSQRHALMRERQLQARVDQVIHEQPNANQQR